MRLPEALRAIRRRSHDQEGMTLIEIIVATAVVALAGALFMAVLISIQDSVKRQSLRSINNDQARQAMEQLDREVRSGNILYDPLVDDPPNGSYPGGMSLRIYTQTNGVPFRCVQWRISGGQLQRRQRDPGYGEPWPSTWQVVAENVVNVERGVRAFHLDADPSKGGRILDATIVVDTTPGDLSDSATISQGVTGRNTAYGYPVSVCDPLVTT